jgi:hypothetical protein
MSSLLAWRLSSGCAWSRARCRVSLLLRSRASSTICREPRVPSFWTARGSEPVFACWGVKFCTTSGELIQFEQSNVLCALSCNFVYGCVRMRFLTAMSCTVSTFAAARYVSTWNMLHCLPVVGSCYPKHDVSNCSVSPTRFGHVIYRCLSRGMQRHAHWLSLSL